MAFENVDYTSLDIPAAPFSDPARIPDFPKNNFVPGRMAMTCCADDTQFIGYICKNPAAKRLRIGSWVTVTAKVKDEFMEVYNGRGPVLYATEIEAAEKPEQELVYFG